MRILLFGAAGQLGRDIQRVLPSAHSVEHAACDITDPEAVVSTIAREKPDMVINAAAMTDVPLCETETPAAFRINALGAKNLALACAKQNAILLQISTDYVFDGKSKRPYAENDLPGPVNSYGITKLAGEHFIQAYYDRYFILRSSGLYGIFPNRGKKTNFVETMLKLGRERDVVKVVDDEILTPTYTYNLAQQIGALIQTTDFGVYHATNQGQCSWYEFTREIFRMAGITTRIEKTTVKEFASPVRRPAYSVLDNQHLRQIGLDRMKPWQESLSDYFKDKENIHHLTGVPIVS